MENTDFNLTAFIDITDQEISHLEKLIELEVWICVSFFCFSYSRLFFNSE